MYRRLLAADIGSTTTKTVLFEIQDGAWAMKGKAVSPTTVEAPHLDVMIGLRQALSKLEALTGIRLLDGARLITPAGRAWVLTYLWLHPAQAAAFRWWLPAHERDHG